MLEKQGTCYYLRLLLLNILLFLPFCGLEPESSSFNFCPIDLVLWRDGGLIGLGGRVVSALLGIWATPSENASLTALIYKRSEAATFS
jgi:hypothetical protein